MPIVSRVLRGLTAAAVIWGAVLPVAVAAAQASGFPQRALHIVVPTGPGSAPDVLTRKLGEAVGARLGQPVVVENRPGAAGMIGAEAVARAKADGYTLLMAWDGMMAINPALYARLAYDPAADFVPVAGLARVEFALVAHPSFAPNNVAELVTYAKERPGQIPYASPGAGEAHHIAMEELKRQAGIDLVHVAYKGGPAALNDVLAGHVPLTIIGLTPALPQLANQRLKALAVLGNARSRHLPSVPTISEALPGYDMEGSWLALFAPAGTPAPVVNVLSEAVSHALADPGLAEFVASQGMLPLPLTPSALDALRTDDTERFRARIQAAKIRIDG